MKIPRGWRKIRRNTHIEDGDRFYLDEFNGWFPSALMGMRVGIKGQTDCTYIRRIQRKKGK
jgi:hypothetical protein